MRTIEPPIYNERRLYEQPIPELIVANEDQEDTNNGQDFVENGPTEVEVERNEMDPEQNDVDVEQNAISEMSDRNAIDLLTNVAGNNELIPLIEVYVPEAEIDPLEIEIKIEADPVELDDQAEAELNQALDDQSSDIGIVDQTMSDCGNDEDDENIFSGEVPKPIWSTENCLVKHEDDFVSGNLPYATRVCIHCLRKILFL